MLKNTEKNNFFNQKKFLMRQILQQYMKETPQVKI